MKDPIDIIYDHLKYLRECALLAEKKRDFWFAVTLGLVSLLLLEIGVPDEFWTITNGILTKQVNLTQTIDLSFAFSVVILALLAATQKYFQLVIETSRHYKALYKLERATNELLQREVLTDSGIEYFSQFRGFSKWSGILYKTFFPAAIAFTTLTRLVIELFFRSTPRPLFKTIDCVTTALLLGTVIIYILSFSPFRKITGHCETVGDSPSDVG